VSVLNSLPAEYRRFNGYTDPRYPEGFWFGRVAVTGDATGGVAALTIQFNTDLTRVSSRIFSLEQLSVFSDETNNRNLSLSVGELGGPTGVQLRGFYQMLMVTFVNGNALFETPFLPLFLGAQNRVGLASFVAVTGANVDTVVMDFEAQGYWWGPRSILAEGGPQRPPTGLYRA